jgi:hypothetical protein
MTKQDWRIERLDDFKEAMAEASLLAEDFKALSMEFNVIADELLLGGKFESYNATAKADKIRSLLAKRNKVVKTMAEAVRDLEPDLKRAGILS